MKLTIELVPASCWYSNLRNRVSPVEWDVIRKQAYREAGYRCAICGAVGKLNCHEVWSYDDDRHIQTLLGFTALSDLCHRIKHIGLAGIQLSEVEFQAVIEHFMAVNGCSREDFEEHERLAFEVWEQRSAHNWICDLGKYKSLVSQGRGES